MNNQFNQFNQKQNPLGMMPAPQKTSAAIKWSIIIIFALLPFVSLYLLTSFSVGVLWAVGIVTVILSIIVVSIMVSLVSDVKPDVIPTHVGILFMMLGFYAIPLEGYLSFFFLLIAPMMFLFGFIVGWFGVGLVMMLSLRKQIKSIQDDPEVKSQMDEMMKEMQKGQGFNPNHKPASSKDSEENYKDNPYVDVKPDPEDEEDEEK